MLGLIHSPSILLIIQKIIVKQLKEWSDHRSDQRHLR